MGRTIANQRNTCLLSRRRVISWELLRKCKLITKSWVEDNEIDPVRHVYLQQADLCTGICSLLLLALLHCMYQHTEVFYCRYGWIKRYFARLQKQGVCLNDCVCIRLHEERN